MSAYSVLQQAHIRLQAHAGQLEADLRAAREEAERNAAALKLAQGMYECAEQELNKERIKVQLLIKRMVDNVICPECGGMDDDCDCAEAWNEWAEREADAALRRQQNAAAHGRMKNGSD